MDVYTQGPDPLDPMEIPETSHGIDYDATLVCVTV